MITITKMAKEKLKEALLEHTTNPRLAFRITPFFSNPTKFCLLLDNEQEGDFVIENEEGRNLLLINPSLAPALEGMVLNHQEAFKN